MKAIRAKLAEGFQRLENKLLAVSYMIVHPNDISDIRKDCGLSEEENGLWTARIIVSDVNRPGFVLLCSELFEEEPPLNRHQLTELVDLTEPVGFKRK